MALDYLLCPFHARPCLLVRLSRIRRSGQALPLVNISTCRLSDAEMLLFCSHGRAMEQASAVRLARIGMAQTQTNALKTNDRCNSRNKQAEHGVRMRALVYIGAGLWICLGVFILCWSLIVGSQATSNRIYKPGQSLFVRFSGNPADYNERGQQYLKRSKRLFLLWMAYLATLFILIVNLIVFWDKLPK